MDKFVEIETFMDCDDAYRGDEEETIHLIPVKSIIRVTKFYYEMDSELYPKTGKYFYEISLDDSLSDIGMYNFNNKSYSLYLTEESYQSLKRQLAGGVDAR